MAHNDMKPTMDAERFGEYIERRLVLYEDQIQLIDRNDLILRLIAAEREQTINLHEFYVAYQHNPALLDDVVRTLVHVVLGELPSGVAERDFADFADRIFFMLKPAELLVEVRERKLPMLVYREFLADLILVYTIDDQRQVSFVNEDHLDIWDITTQDIHERALVNLRQRTNNVRYTSVGKGEQGLFIYNSGDGYDASRLLLSEVTDDWARKMPGQLVLGIPNRDFLVGFSDANPDILRAVAAQIQLDTINHAYGLTEQLFTVIDGQVREYEWE